MKKYLTGIAAVTFAVLFSVPVVLGAGYGITITSDPPASTKLAGRQYENPTVKLGVGKVVTFHSTLQTSAADAAGVRLEGTFEWNIDPTIFSCPGYSALNTGDITCTIQAEGSTEVSVTFHHTIDGEEVDSVTSDPIFVMPPPAQPARKSLPPAGYEDKVLTNVEAFSNPFPDTDANQLGGKAAAELYRRAVIGGYPDGQFKGSLPVNRAEAAKFLLLARYGTVADVSNNGIFPDLLDGQWYIKYVITAAQKGIIKGYPDGFFRPADQVKTAEFLKMLSITFGLQQNMPYSYTDVTRNDWFDPYAGIASYYKLFPNRTTSLLPGQVLTREDVAVAIYQYLYVRAAP